MKIGIDCRIFGVKHTGIGRYVQNLVLELLKEDKKNNYVLFVRKDFQEKFENENVKIVIADIPHYSVKEQIIFPLIIANEKLDLVHFPHFNVPVFFQGKYIVTIHDLIKHSSKGKETTTKSGWIYWLKYFGYKFVFEKSVKRAFRIITPSKFVKDEIIKEYKICEDKIKVTYEGVDKKLQITNYKLQIKSKSQILKKYGIEKPYLLYVGSVYPHKNIERLIEAIKKLNFSLTPKSLTPITLVIVCARNVFSERLNNNVIRMKAGNYVNLVGFVSDQDLAVLYKEAEAFIFPTLSEGFGLPGLEAMSLGCPVICSEIPVLKEIYKDSAIYFNPLDFVDIAEKIKGFLSDKGMKEKLSLSGLKLAETYSWSKTVKETLGVYDKC